MVMLKILDIDFMCEFEKCRKTKENFIYHSEIVTFNVFIYHTHACTHTYTLTHAQRHTGTYMVFEITNTNC